LIWRRRSGGSQRLRVGFSVLFELDDFVDRGAWKGWVSIGDRLHGSQVSKARPGAPFA
jgi:hypothetical protein